MNSYYLPGMFHLTRGRGLLLLLLLVFPSSKGASMEGENTLKPLQNTLAARSFAKPRGLQDFPAITFGK